MSATIDPTPESPPKRRKKRSRKRATEQSAASSPLLATTESPSQAALGGQCWRKPAPAGLRKSALPLEQQWRLFWKHARLAKEGKTRLSEIASLAKVSPLAEELMCVAADRKRRLAKSNQSPGARVDAMREVESSLAQFLSTPEEATLDYAVACLAAAAVLQQCGGSVEPQTGWRTLDALWNASAAGIARPLDEQAAPDAVLAQQILGGELPLALSRHFAALAPMHVLGKAAQKRLEEAVEELLNGDGLPSGRHVAAMRALVACWTRSRDLAAGKRSQAWSARTEKGFRRAVAKAVRWTAPDGGALLGGRDCGDEFQTIRRAVKSCRDKPVRAAAKALQQPRRNPRTAPARKRFSPADYSEWSELGVMRAQWSRLSPTLAVNHAHAALEIELWAEGLRLLGGSWETRSTIDGQPLAPIGPWEELCWFSDADVDFLELAQPLSGGARLERQVLLARRDRFALLCDHLQSEREADLAHAWRLPMDARATLVGEAETRDAQFHVGKRRFRALPLALPEWRIEGRAGELAAAAGDVTLGHVRRGLALACPLLIDLDPRRSLRQCTWRQLTVAEGLAICTPDVAVSYRAQCGSDQWIFYRAQRGAGNRTFLGRNTSSEYMAARFLPKEDEAKVLLEIEG